MLKYLFICRNNRNTSVDKPGVNCYAFFMFFVIIALYRDDIWVIQCQILKVSRNHPSPSPYPQVHSLVGLCLYSRLATRFFMTFFFFSLRFHIYVLAYCTCFSLSGLLHSVRQTFTPSTSLQIPPFHFFLWLSNIPLYICATSSLSIHPMMDT